MIKPFSPAPVRLDGTSYLNKGLMQVRHIQARLKEGAVHPIIRGVATADHFHLPVNGWFD